MEPGEIARYSRAAANGFSWCPQCGNSTLEAPHPRGRLLMCEKCGWSLVDVKVEPMEDKPTDCPRCSKKIELQGDTYYCTDIDPRLWFDGAVQRQSPACNWSGKASDYGKTWR